VTTPLRTGETPLAHYLPYWWIDNDLVVNVDGSVALAWEITGIDATCITNTDLNNKAAALSRTLNQLPVGYHLQWLRRSRQLDDAFFDGYRNALRTHDALLREQRALSADRLRTLGLRTFETYAVLVRPHALGRFGTAARDGASNALNKLARKSNPLDVTLAQHEAARREIEATASNVLQTLRSTGIVAKPLAGDALLQLLFRFVNPSATPQNSPSLTEVLPRELPAISPVYRDLSLREQVLRTSVSWDLDTLSLDDPLRPHRILAMKDVPRLIGSDLAFGYRRLEHDHWLSVGITALDTLQREGKMERRRNAAFSRARGRFTRDARASAEHEELERALDEMAKRDQRLFDVNVHVLISADNLVELDDRTRTSIESVRSATKLNLVTATYSQLQSWLGMMPGNGHAAPHRRAMFTDYAANLIPIYVSATGSSRPLFVLSHRSTEPYSLDIANPKKQNWNTNIFGSSGAGKSFFTAAKIASSILGQGSPLTIIDVGGRDPHGNIIGSYYRLCQVAGGEYFEFNLDGRNAINAFMPKSELYASDRGEPSAQPNTLKLKFLTGILEMLVKNEDDPPLTPIQIGLLQRAVVGVYERWGAQRTPLLEDLIPELQALTGDRDDTTTARAYAKTLQAWVSGPYGKLLNTPSRITPRTPFTVFDMKGLEDLGRLAPVIMMILTGYVWNMIARPRHGLAWVIYDECWKLLSDPTAARLQEELYRTARKLNCGVVSVTQRLEDFLSSPGAKAVLANAENTFLLRHTKDHDTVAKMTDLNPREYALFKSLETRKGYYSEVLFKPAEGSVDNAAVLRYYAGPLDYWFNTTDPVDRELEREVLQSVGGDRASALRRLATDYPNGATAGGYARKEVA
jgi:type IV secretory pathway VirB4 component